MSAKSIFASAPLGATIEFSDGTPQPPARFTKKLSAWKDKNGRGRLCEKQAGDPASSHPSPDRFTLHIGDFGGGGVITITLRQSCSVNSPLDFRVVATPAVGEIQVITRSTRGHEELRKVLPSLSAAASWLQSNRYPDAFFREITGNGAYVDHPATDAIAA